jgi:hypothetical protein
MQYPPWLSCRRAPRGARVAPAADPRGALGAVAGGGRSDRKCRGPRPRRCSRRFRRRRRCRRRRSRRCFRRRLGCRRFRHERHERGARVAVNGAVADRVAAVEQFRRFPLVVIIVDIGGFPALRCTLLFIVHHLLPSKTEGVFSV